MAGRRKSTSKKPLANPSELAVLNPEDGRTFQVIIETPKGSRNKYSFDATQRIFRLKHVLPAGMAFPYDFGFVPSTKAEDDDPIDVLVLMDEAAFPGCLVECRLIGVIEAEETDKGEPPFRNDRLIGVSIESHSLTKIRDLKDLGEKFVRQLEAFFVNYHELQGKKYKLVGTYGPEKARKLVKKAAIGSPMTR